MPVVAFVLTEGFAVIAEHDPQRALRQASRAQTVDERAERSIAVVQRVAVASEFITVRERTGLRRLVRMMAGDRHVCDEEPLTGRRRIDPFEDGVHRGRLVHAEAGIAMAADVAGVGERAVAAIAHDRLHPQVGEASGVEERRAISAAGQDGDDRSARHVCVQLRCAVEGGIRRAERREETLDAFRIDGVSGVEDDRALGQLGQMRHDIRRRPVHAEILRGGRFETDEHDVAAGRAALEA